MEKKLGASSLLIIFQLGSILSALFIAFSDTFFSLGVGLILIGLFSSIYHPAGLTILSQQTKNISKSMAIHGIGGSIGLALGPLIGAVFTDFSSWRLAYLTIAVFNLILLIITLYNLERLKDIQIIKNNREKNENKTNKSALKYYYAISILMGFTFTGFTTFIPTHFAVETRLLFIDVSDTLRGGIFTSLVLLTGIIGQSLAGWAGKRFSLTKYLFWIIVLNIPFLIILGFSSHHWLILSSLLFGIIHFNWQPIANSLLAHITHNSKRGLGYGINFFLNIGIGSIAAVVCGIIAEKYSLTFVFPVLGIILTPALLLSWILIGKVR